MREMILGLLQGLTEFLPVSSSGHLVIGQHFLPGAQNIDQDVLLDILLHFATLLVVIVYYRQDIAAILREVLSLRRVPRLQAHADRLDASPARQAVTPGNMLLLLIVGSIPTGIIGVGVKLSGRIADLFSSLPLVGVSLLATGMLLYLSETLNLSTTKETISYCDALIIGTVQGIAVLPGISRSGSTISAGILRGIERTIAAKFSFLLSIPAILGAVVIEAKDIATLASLPSVIPDMLGMLTAFAAGYFALMSLIRIVLKRRLRWFAFYCWTIGGMVLLYSLLGPS